MELARQAVDDDLQVQLAHAGDDGLARLLIGISLEGRVLLRQLGEGDTHFFLAGFRLGLDGDADNRVRELHGLQHQRALGVAERVAGARLFQADRRGDVASVDGLQVLPVVGVHLQHAAQALVVVLGGVINRGTGVHLAGIDAEIDQLADERVRCDLEGERGERLVIGSVAVHFLAGFRIGPLDGGDIRRGGHESDDRVQQLLHALVFIGRTACDRHEFVGNGRLADGGDDLFPGQLLAVQVFFHHRVVLLGNRFQQLGTVLFGDFFHIVRDFLDAHILAHFIVIDIRFHVDEVDDAPERVFLADRQLDGHGVGLEPVLHHLHGIEKVGAHNVHLVDIRHARDAELLRLAPHGLGLRLDAAFRGKDRDVAVQHAQGALHFHREVHVAGGVDNIDAVVLPEAGGGGGSDGDAALLLFRHPVHGGVAVMDLAHFMIDSGIIQDTLRRRCLTGIDMGRNADIPY